jgi:hypothetical protein
LICLDFSFWYSDIDCIALVCCCLTDKGDMEVNIYKLSYVCQSPYIGIIS